MPHVLGDAVQDKIVAALQELSDAKTQEAQLPVALQGDDISTDILAGMRSGAFTEAEIQSLIQNSTSARPDDITRSTKPGMVTINKVSRGLIDQATASCIGPNATVQHNNLSGWGIFSAGKVDFSGQGDNFDQLGYQPVSDLITQQNAALRDDNACLIANVTPIAANDQVTRSLLVNQIDDFTKPQDFGPPDVVNRPNDFPAGYGYKLPLFPIKTLSPELVSKTKDQDATESSWWRKHFQKVGDILSGAGVYDRTVQDVIGQMIANADTMYPQQMQYTVPFYRQQYEALVDMQAYLNPVLDEALRRRLSGVIAGWALATHKGVVDAIVNLVYLMADMSGVNVRNNAKADQLVARALTYATALLTTPVTQVAKNLAADVPNMAGPLDVSLLTNLSLTPQIQLINIHGGSKNPLGAPSGAPGEGGSGGTSTGHKILVGFGILALVTGIAAASVAVYRKRKGLPAIPSDFTKPLR